MLADIEQALSIVQDETWDWENKRVLDFGCGCGRLLRHLINTGACLSACDINQPSMDWIRENLPTVTTPPEGCIFSGWKYMFDVILVVSVFTEIEDQQYERDWLTLIAEQLTPNGILLVTTHGKAAFEFFCQGANYKARNAGRWVRKLENELQVFHWPNYIREEWEKILPVTAIYEDGLVSFQDIIVLQKPGPETDDRHWHLKEREFVAQQPEPTVFPTPRNRVMVENRQEVRMIGFDKYGLNLEQLKLVADLGIDAVTMNCDWQRVEPEPDVWEWDRWKQYREDAAAAGLKLIFRGPHFFPTWMSGEFGMYRTQQEMNTSGLHGRVPSFWNLEIQKRIDDFYYRAWDALGIDSFWAIEANVGASGGETKYMQPPMFPYGLFKQVTQLSYFDPEAIKAFQWALRARWDDDLDSFNCAHDSAWENWSDVTPPADVQTTGVYFPEAMLFHEQEMLRYTDLAIHRHVMAGHRRIIIVHATSLSYEAKWFGQGCLELDAQLPALCRTWENRMVDIRQAYYSSLTYNRDLRWYFSLLTQRYHPSKCYTGCEFATGAEENLPKIHNMGFYGGIVNVNKGLFELDEEYAPTKLITENAEILRKAIGKFKQ